MLNKSLQRLAVIGLVTSSALAVLAACSDDDDNKVATTPAEAGAGETGTDATPAVVNGSVSGTVSYQGVKRNQAIYTVLFTTLPPDPTKIGGASVVPTPMLPGTNAFTIKDVKPGTYYFACQILPLVQGPPPPPEADTPTSELIPVTVAAGQELKLPEIVLTDPQQDGGADGGTDAADGG